MAVISTDGLIALLDESGFKAEPRIGVMFGILFISLFAVSFPAVSKQIPFLRIPHLVFFIGKHFGTGAILSTAFCHLLPDAFASLQKRDVNERYNGIGKWTGMIILGSLLTIFLVEYASTSYVDHLHAEPSAPPSPSTSAPPSRPKTPSVDTTGLAGTSTPQRVIAPVAYLAERNSPPPLDPSTPSQKSTPIPHNALPATETTPLMNRVPKRTKSLCNFVHTEDDSLLPLFFLNAPRLARGGLPHSGLVWGREVGCVCPLGRRAFVQPCEIEGAAVDEELSEAEEKNIQPKIGRKRQVVGILILQLGIMIHSLVIGLTLAVTSGADFSSLVIAIIFHQLFEGLSLGIRIAGLPPAQPPSHPTRSRSSSFSITESRASSSLSRHDHDPWRLTWLTPTLSILFAITTPVGMVAGLIAFTSTDAGASPEQSARMHLIQGLMSGISAGMLIYAATVEMLAGDFVFGDVGGDHGHGHDHEHSHSRTETKRSGIWRRVLAVVSLLAGATTMALVGLGE